MCTLIWYLGLMGIFFLNPSLLLSWMPEHYCLVTCCFGCLTCMCFIFLRICNCAARFSMFRVERRSRNTLITIIIIINIIIIIIIIIIVIVITTGT